MAKLFDVLVIGGGPAGIAASILLARAGLTVAIVERSNYESTRVGETLPPQIKPLLQSLGVWDSFIEDNHLPSQGNVFIWGSNISNENDYIFSPYGCGWHLNRQIFDRRLSQIAEKKGVIVYKKTSIVSYVHHSLYKWTVKIVCDNEQNEMKANFLIDAAGRRSVLASFEKVKRIVHDRLIGVVKFIASDEETRDHRTYIESVENGWWYCAALPNRKFIAAFMTDSDLLPKGSQRIDSYWRQELDKTQLIRKKLKTGLAKPDSRILSANTTVLTTVKEADWLAVGDAAVTLDPLSSMGIYHALDSGIQAAGTVHRILNGEVSDKSSYQEWNKMFVKNYLSTQAKFYNFERRWAESPFWKRRLK